MTYRIGDLRNLDMNLYYFVSSGLTINGYIVLSGFDQTYVYSGIYLQDGYPDDYNNIKTPGVSIEHLFSRDDPFQLGTGKEDIRRFQIDVYANTDGQRDDLGELIKNFFYSSMVIYDYNMVITGGQYIVAGTCDFENLTMFPLRDPTYEATKHRMRITFDCSVPIGQGYTLL